MIITYMILAALALAVHYSVPTKRAPRSTHEQLEHYFTNRGKR